MKACFCCRTLCRLPWNICEGEEGQWCHRKLKAQIPPQSLRELFVSGKMCIVPESVIDMVQACRIPKNVRSASFHRSLSVWEDFDFPPGTVPSFLLLPGKERACEKLRFRAAICLWGGKKYAWNRCGHHLPSRATIWVRWVCDSGRYGLGTTAETTKGEEPRSGRGQELEKTPESNSSWQHMQCPSN